MPAPWVQSFARRAQKTPENGLLTTADLLQMIFQRVQINSLTEEVHWAGYLGRDVELHLLQECHTSSTSCI